MSRLSRLFNWFFGVLVVCLLMTIAGGGYYFHRRQVQLDAKQAHDTLERARVLIRDLEESALAERHQKALRESRDSVDYADGLLKKGRYRECTAEVEGVMDRLRPLQGEMENPREGGRIVALVGGCALLRRGAALPEPLMAGAEVREGDELESRSDGQALLQLPNGETAAIEPSSALRIESLPGLGREGFAAVRLVRGGMVFHSPPRVRAEHACRVLAAPGELRAQPGSRFSVEVTGPDSLAVKAYEGVVQVRGGLADETVRGGLEAETATLTPRGLARGPALTAPPHPETPADGTLYRVRPGESRYTALVWDASRVGTARVQVADNPLFARGVILDKSVSGGSAQVGPLAAGAYFWRLRASSGEGRSFWSSPARFRVMGLPGERKAPDGLQLEVEATPVGDSLLVKGKVHPRALVTVNDVEVTVGEEGTFVGTFPLPPRGPRGRSVTVCAFDEKGNEKVWEKVF
jgi:hypothetical protein